MKKLALACKIGLSLDLFRSLEKRFLHFSPLVKGRKMHESRFKKCYLGRDTPALRLKNEMKRMKPAQLTCWLNGFLFILVALACLFMTKGAFAQPNFDSFCFAVTADSRADDRINLDPDGVNEYVLQKVLEDAKGQTCRTTGNPPEFLLFNGDLVNGKDTDGSILSPELLKGQFINWKNFVEDYFPSDQVLPGWGGHERNKATPDETAVSVWKAWKDCFKTDEDTTCSSNGNSASDDKFDPKGDGSATCVYPPNSGADFGNTVYYCDYQNARFFVLNNDIDCSDDEDDPTRPSTCLEHQIGSEQLRWISYNLTGKELYFFGYHEAAYGTCAHQGVNIPSGNFLTMDKFPDARNTFIERIDSFATMSFSGHEHQYSRRRINNSLYSQIGGDLNSNIEGDFFEVKAGTCGAPIYGPYGTDGQYKAPCMDNVEAYEAWPDKYYYSVIEVDNRGAQPIVYGTTYAVDAGSGATQAVDFFEQPDHQVWKIGGPGEREDDWKYYGSDTPPTEDRSWTYPEYVPGSEWLSGCTDDFALDYNNGLRSGIGYDDEDDCEPEISGMKGNFSNVYARKTFNLNPAEVGDDPLMTLAVNFDDGFEAFINGELVGTWPREGGSVGQHEAGSSNTGGGIDVPGEDETIHIDWGRKRPPEQYPLDAATVRSALAGRTEHVLAIKGINENINSSDFSLAASLRVAPSICEGDFEPDGDVDGSDLAVFAADFGRTDCSNDCEGDFNSDGDVDGSDLAIFAADFGRTDCPASD